VTVCVEKKLLLSIKCAFHSITITDIINKKVPTERAFSTCNSNTVHRI